MSNSVDPDETAHKSRLTWIYAVCKSLLLPPVAVKELMDIMKGLCQSYEPQCEKTYILVCVPNGDSNQPAHPRSLIKVFVVSTETFCILGYRKCA